MPMAVRLGAAREVVIPRRFREELGIAPGDYLEISVERGRLVLTPKAVLEKRLAESQRAGRDACPAQQVPMRVIFSSRFARSFREEPATEPVE